jgi:hypothetical protein
VGPDPHSTTLKKLQQANLEANISILNALFGALADLLARSRIKVIRARQETFSRWYSISPLETYYIVENERGTGDLGNLEKNLLEKISNWGEQPFDSEDMVAPTPEGLIQTFRDQDGDFSQYQIRKLIIEDGESREVFSKTGKGLWGKLMPVIEPLEGSLEEVKKAQQLIGKTAEYIVQRQTGLGNSLSLAFNKVVLKRFDKTRDPLHRMNSELRKKLLAYIVAISFAFALVLCLIASR